MTLSLPQTLTHNYTQTENTHVSQNWDVTGLRLVDGRQQFT